MASRVEPPALSFTLTSPQPLAPESVPTMATWFSVPDPWLPKRALELIVRG